MAIIKFTGLNESELKKLETALKEEDFVAKLNDATDATVVQSIFAERGINFTADEIEEIRSTMEKAMKSSGELSENDLEEVAGGGGTFTLFEIEWKTKKGVKIKVNIPW